MVKKHIKEGPGCRGTGLYHTALMSRLAEVYTPSGA